MKKKKSAKSTKSATTAKKRPKPKARRSQKARLKSSPRAITSGGVRTDKAGSKDSTQSGDTQGLSGYAGADSESVKELAEEGQYLEAEAVEGVEDAPDADAGPIKTREVSEDDVPEEYLVDDNRDQQS